MENRGESVSRNSGGMTGTVSMYSNRVEKFSSFSTDRFFGVNPRLSRPRGSVFRWRIPLLSLPISAVVRCRASQMGSRGPSLVPSRH